MTEQEQIQEIKEARRLRDLVATIRERDRQIAELLKEKRRLDWLTGDMAAERDVLIDHNALMLEALELALDKLTSGWDMEWDCEPREAGIRVLSEALGKVEGASGHDRATVGYR